eukprot:8939674-Pyramimonas_sp.AAC.1
MHHICATSQIFARFVMSSGRPQQGIHCSFHIVQQVREVGAEVRKGLISAGRDGTNMRLGLPTHPTVRDPTNVHERGCRSANRALGDPPPSSSIATEIKSCPNLEQYEHEDQDAHAASSTKPPSVHVEGL